MPSLRTVTIRVTGADGVPLEGTSFRRAVCVLVRRRAAATATAASSAAASSAAASPAAASPAAASPAAASPAAPDGEPRLPSTKDETLLAALRRVAANASGATEPAEAAARGQRQ